MAAMKQRGCRSRFAGALIGLLGANSAAGEAEMGKARDGLFPPSLQLAIVDSGEATTGEDAAAQFARVSESLRFALAEVPSVSPDATRGPDAAGAPPTTANSRRLPFLGDLARERGYELPQPFGAGAVFYYLSRGIDIGEVRLGRNGAPVEPVGDFVDLGSNANVANANVKFDLWLLPFLNVYAIAGYIWNEADTRLDLTLPPLVPGGASRRRSVVVPTAVEGSVGGLGVTLAGGYRSLFFAADINAARADLGFDEEFDAVVSSLRGGWNGKAGSRPLRLWLNATYWDTAAVARGTIADPDGGTLAFEVEQGPLYPWTYGAGAQLDILPSFHLAADVGADFHGGWYVVLVPVFRF